VGFHVSRAHAAAGDSVILVDNLSKTGGRTDPELDELLSQPNVELLTTDLTTDASGVAASGPFDLVYHLAAINGTHLFYEIPYELARTNIAITVNVLRALEAAPPRRLVYASTSEVYADGEALGTLRIPTDESTAVVFAQPTNARFSYGASKFIGEFLCLQFQERYGVSTTVVRPHNVYGPRMGTRHVVPELVNRIMAGERPLRVYGPEETRAFCYIDDVVDAIRKVAELTEPCDIVHIGDPKEIRIADLAKRIMAVMGVDLEIVDGGRRPHSVSRRCPDISKLQRLTGFTPQVGLDEGLRRTVRWYQDQPRGQVA